MSREDIQKLLGGYATDTLTDAEKRLLFEAALEDQDLFDALAKEQALREVLQEASARRHLIEVLGPAHQAFGVRVWRWLRRPAALAMAGGLAVLLIVSGIVLRQTMRQARPETMMADALSTYPPAPAPAHPGGQPTLNIPANIPALKASKKEEPHAAEGKARRQALQLPSPTSLNGPNAPLVVETAPPAQTSPVTLPSAALPPVPPPPAAPPPTLLPLAAPAVSGNAVSGNMERDAAVHPAVQTTPAPLMRFGGSGSPEALLGRAKAAAAKAKAAAGYDLLVKGADGTYTPVPSGGVFHAGDSVRVRFTPTAAGYIYLFQRDTAAGWKLVASRQAEPGQRYVLPSTGGLQSDIPAQLEFRLVLSRGELSAPAAAGAAGGSADVLAPNALTSLRIPIEFR